MDKKKMALWAPVVIGVLVAVFDALQKQSAQMPAWAVSLIGIALYLLKGPFAQAVAPAPAEEPKS